MLRAQAFVSAPTLAPRSARLPSRVCLQQREGLARPRGVGLRRVARASLVRDFTAGPEEPGFPRRLTQVILFSSLTGLLWYGWYKYCIEEELRTRGLGRGALFALGPFTAGLVLTAFVPRALAPATATAAVAWIIGIQFTLYRRINAMYAARGDPQPLHPHWVVLPGLNLVAGLRSVHFLAVLWARERGESEHDWLAARLPFLGVDTLSALQLFTSPKLWFQL